LYYLAEDDYVSGPYYVTFLASQTIVVFNVSIIVDDLVEGNENFNLTINLLSLPSNVKIGDPVNTTVTIVDDDCELEDETICISLYQYIAIFATTIQCK